MRCVLTRSLGKDPTIQVDYYTVPVNRGDYLVQCSDGMHHCVPRRSSARSSPTPRPTRPAENWWPWRKSGAPTIISPCRSSAIDRVEEVMFYRGLPIYRERELPMST